MKISRVQEMRDADARAIADFGIPQEILMENAGQAAAFVLQNAIEIENKKCLFFCGVGNNGGDGLVVARKLHSNGAKVSIFLLNDPHKFSGSAKLNYEIVQKLQLSIRRLQSAAEAQTEVTKADVIIDAIFGTGLAREVGGLYREIIETINASEKPVFSLDIPSGINGDNGQLMGAAVKARQTITFGLPKLGNLLYPGFEHGGQLSVTHISFPLQLHSADSLKIETNAPPPLPVRKGNAHKGSVGKALFIAGAANYHGAPWFSAHAFLKAGGGLSFLAAPEIIIATFGAECRELVFLPMAATADGSIACSNKEKLIRSTATVDLVVIGPGLSLNEETQRLTAKLIAEIDKPLLIDGDGITAVRSNVNLIKERKAATVLTPHPGEMSRLCGYSISEIEANRVDIVQETAGKFNAVIVLKGAHSLIGMPDGRVYINLSGNPGMATAGSGDVLTGAIAAMFGLGLSIEQAVRTGVFLHGFAGDLAAAETGPDGLIAGDILNALPVAIKKYRAEHNAIFKNNYNKIFLL